MQANWSLILNVLLLIGVIVAIGRLMKARKQSLSPEQFQPPVLPVEASPYDTPSFSDDIIAVRKVSQDSELGDEPYVDSQWLKKPVQKSSRPSQPSRYAQQAVPQLEPLLQARPIDPPKATAEVQTEPHLIADCMPEKHPMQDKSTVAPETVMMFLSAKENRQFAGYELLQTVLASGLRFGEGHLFHRHQLSNGQGPVLCSLAAATATGVFDLQNIGAFSVRGLCLFMHSSHNPGIDEERFGVMLETARQLSEGLDAYWLDDRRKPISNERLAHYRSLLRLERVEEDCLSA